MATKVLDTRGLRCPQPILAIITTMHETCPGDLLEVAADCPTFEDDVRRWCERSARPCSPSRATATRLSPPGIQL